MQYTIYPNFKRLNRLDCVETAFPIAVIATFFLHLVMMIPVMFSGLRSRKSVLSKVASLLKSWVFDDYHSLLISAAIAFVVAFIVVYLSALQRERRFEERRAEQTANRVSEIAEEAKQYVESVIHDQISRCRSQLSVTESEFADRAFSAFWEAVASSKAGILGIIYAISELKGKAATYNSLLAAESHTFPKFPIDSTAIPVVDDLLEELVRIVRKGETDFEFATFNKDYPLGRSVRQLKAQLEEARKDLNNEVESARKGG